MPSTVIIFNHDAHEEMLETPTGSPKVWADKLENFVASMKSGLTPASVIQYTDDTAAAYATGTVTVASIQADDTITINGTTITGKASPSGESQFDSDGTDTVVAAAIAACINANSSFTGIVTATSADAVITVSAYVPGLIGNAVTLASSNGTRLAVSAARLTSGTGMGEAAVTYAMGK
jgi:phage tail sheath gpL-like